MKLGGIENKARIALTFFVVALLLTIGLSLTLYFEARRQFATERIRRVKVEAALLAVRLPAEQASITDAVIQEQLLAIGISGAAAIFGSDGACRAQASTIDHGPPVHLLTPKFYRAGNQKRVTPPVLLSTLVRTEGGFDIAEFPALDTGSVVVLSRPIETESSPVIFYFFSYQIIALVIGLALLILLGRWLLRPYRRMVEAARGSPVRAPAEVSEGEFVVQTFQALVDQLHSKERELAQLHLLERKRAEKSEQFSERLIANIPSGLVTISSGGIVTSANGHAREIFGPGELLGYGDLVAGPSNPALDFREFFATAPRMVELIWQCLDTGAAFRREEVEAADADGRVRHLGLSVSPITDTTHNIEGALCLMTDITEVMELRDRMKLQENLANLGEMAAGLAHEFKNSLATIHGYVQLLDSTNGNADAESRRPLDAVLNEVRLLARLVTDFLNFARPQQITLADVDLKTVIEESAAEIDQQVRQVDAVLKIEGRFATLAGDESLLRRAFVNLLRNAAEAIDPQSPTRSIQVVGSVDAGRGKQYAHIRIRDTGTGISGQDLNRIFIPFFTTKSRGYGIGLALVQKILVAHGGSVTVEQSDRHGTTFHCRLPLSGPVLAVEK